MKSSRYLLLLPAVLAAVFSCTREPAHAPSIPKDAAIEKQIDRILSKMTLDDKVGQMLQINIDVLGGYTLKDGRPVWALDASKVDTMIANYRVGSFLNAPGMAGTPDLFAGRYPLPPADQRRRLLQYRGREDHGGSDGLREPRH